MNDSMDSPMDNSRSNSKATCPATQQPKPAKTIQYKKIVTVAMVTTNKVTTINSHHDVISSCIMHVSNTCYAYTE